jgi:hypothetical protein
MFEKTNKPKASATDNQLVELLDRILDRGVAVHGEISISVANVDLIYLGLNVLLTSIDKLEELRNDGHRIPLNTLVAKGKGGKG